MESKRRPPVSAHVIVQSNTERTESIFIDQGATQIFDMTLFELARRISTQYGYPLEHIRFDDCRSKYINKERTGCDELDQINVERDTVKKCFGSLQDDQMIHYNIVDVCGAHEEEQTDGSDSIFEDAIPSEKLEAIHNVYPFTRNSRGGTIVVPNWAKEILYQRMTI